MENLLRKRRYSYFRAPKNKIFKKEGDNSINKIFYDEILFSDKRKKFKNINYNINFRIHNYI